MTKPSTLPLCFFYLVRNFSPYGTAIHSEDDFFQAYKGEKKREREAKGKPDVITQAHSLVSEPNLWVMKTLVAIARQAVPSHLKK